MMGGGSFGQGSTAPSSTLSPLAPPFTVSCSALKPKPSPQPHVFDDQFDGSQRRPYLGNYLNSYSPNPIPISDSLPHLGSDIESVQGYGHFGIQWTVSRGTRSDSLSPNIHGLSCEKKLESIADNVSGEDSYYPQWPSAIYDGISSGLKESSYGTLNSGTAASLEGSSQTSYLHNDYWFSGPGKDIDPKSSQKEAKGKFLSHYSSSLLMGDPATEAFMACGEGPSAWHGKPVESSAGEVYNGLTGTVLERIDDKYSAKSEQGATIPSFNVPVTSVLVPSTQETTYSNIPDPSFMKTWNDFNQNASYERCFAPRASCPADSTILYPSVTIQSTLLAGGSSSSLNRTVLKGMTSHDQPIHAIKNKNSVGQVSVKAKPHTFTLNIDTGKVNNDTGKDDHISLESSPMGSSVPLNQKSICENSLIDSSKKELEHKLTGLKHPKDPTCAPCTDGPSDCKQMSSDALDQCISAVDSPCWKGTSSWHSPFTVVDTDVLISQVKAPEFCKDSSQHNQILPVSADDAEVVPSPKPCRHLNNHETRGVENSSFTSKHPSVVCSVYADTEKSGLNCYKFGCENGAPYPDGLLNPGDGFELYNSPETVSGLQPPDQIPFRKEDEVVTSDKKPMLQTGIKELVVDSNAAKEGSSDFYSHDIQQYVPKLDVSMLVKTIHNISELLKFSHCGNANVLNKNDHEIIRLAIDNLGGLVRPLSKSTPEFGSSCSARKPSDPQKEGINVGRPLATDADSKNDQTLNDHQSSLLRERMLHLPMYRSSEKEYSLRVVAKSGEMDVDKDTRLMETIKNAIEQNICGQGEHQLQTLSYKNLWIEAEAKLCSIKYELQLARMEIEKEKSKKYQAEATDLQNSSCATQKTADGKSLLGVNAKGDIRGKETSASDGNMFPNENAINKSSHSNSALTNTSGNYEEAEDVETSVMARFRVLESRDHHVSSMIQ